MFRIKLAAPLSGVVASDGPEAFPTFPERSKRDGTQSMSSSFKKKFFSGLGKLKSLKGGGQKGSGKRQGASKGLSDLDEDHELTYSPQGPLEGARPESSGVASLLRNCQQQSNVTARNIGMVPMVSLDGLRQALHTSPQAVVVLRVGADPPGHDPAPNSIKHCSSELPRAFQERIASQAANAARSTSLASPRQPSFSRALGRVRRQSAEGLSMPRSAVIAAASAAAGHAATGNGYFTSPRRIHNVPPGAAAQMGSAALSFAGAAGDTTAIAPAATTATTCSVPCNLTRHGAAESSREQLARDLTASGSSKLWSAGSGTEPGVVRLQLTVAGGTGVDGSRGAPSTSTATAATSALHGNTAAASDRPHQVPAPGAVHDLASTAPAPFDTSAGMMPLVGSCVPASHFLHSSSGVSRGARAAANDALPGLPAAVSGMRLTVQNVIASAVAGAEVVRVPGGGVALSIGDRVTRSVIGTATQPAAVAMSVGGAAAARREPLEERSSASVQAAVVLGTVCLAAGAGQRFGAAPRSHSCAGAVLAAAPSTAAATTTAAMDSTLGDDDGILGRLDSDDDGEAHNWAGPRSCSGTGAGATGGSCGAGIILHGSQTGFIEPSRQQLPGLPGCPSAGSSGTSGVRPGALTMAVREVDGTSGLVGGPCPGPRPSSGPWAATAPQTGVHTPLGSTGPSSACPTLAGAGGSERGYSAAEPCVLPVSPFVAALSMGSGSIADAARGISAAAAGSAAASTGAGAAPSGVASLRPGVAASAVASMPGALPLMRTEAAALSSAAAAASTAVAPAADPPSRRSNLTHLTSSPALAFSRSFPAMAATAVPVLPEGLCGEFAGMPHPSGDSCGTGSCSGGGGTQDSSDGGDASDPVLEPLFVSPATEGVMGSAEPDHLRITLYQLLSHNPSLQLILEDIIRSALVGRPVVHEQLVAWPRASPGPGPSPSPGLGDTGRYGPSPPATRPPLTRNPLDDFLLVQVTACYMDQQPACHLGASPAKAAPPPPPSLPALFISFSRPYSSALSAVGVLPPGPVLQSATAAATTASGYIAGPVGVGGDVSTRGSQSGQHAYPPLSRTSGLSAANRLASSVKLPKSPSLGSLFGSLSRTAGARQGAGLGFGVAGSPGPSPKAPHAGAGQTGSHNHHNYHHDHHHVHHNQQQQRQSYGDGVSLVRQPSGSSASTLGPGAPYGVFGGSSGSADAAPSSGGLAREVAAAEWQAAVAAAVEGFCAHVRLEQQLLTHVPAAVTMLALDGRVLYQNGRSAAFMGYVVGFPGYPAGLDISNPGHTLQRIFSYDTPALASLWEAVHSGKTWNGLVCMPQHLELGVCASDTLHDLLVGRSPSAGTDDPRSIGALGLFAPDVVDTDMVGQLMEQLRRQSGGSVSGGGGELRTSSNQTLYTGPLDGGGRGPNGRGGGGDAAATGALHGHASAHANVAAFPDQAHGASPGLGWMAPSSPASPLHGVGVAERRSALCASAALAATASADALCNVAGTCGSSAGRARAQLPRNGSAPSFRGGGAACCPLPSVQEAEASAIGTLPGAAAEGTGGSCDMPLLNATSAAAPLAAGNLWRRTSWNTFTTSACAASSASLYGSSPVSGSSPGAALLAGVQAQLPASRRTRIHRSNSLAQTEVALGGSYRAMRLAASAMSQGLLGPGGPQSLAGPGGGVAGCSGGGGGGGSTNGLTNGSWSGGYGDVLRCSSPRAVQDAVLGVSGGVPLAVDTTAAAAGYSPRAMAFHPYGCGAAGAGSPVTAICVGAASPGCGGAGGSSMRTHAASPVRLPPSSHTSATGLRVGADDFAHAVSGGGALGTVGSGCGVSQSCGLPCLSACCWHEVQANLVQDPVTLQWRLLLVQQDVTEYVRAELEVRQVLDAEHRILEECFPRHVLEVMTSDKRRSSAFGAAGGLGLGPVHPAGPLLRSSSVASSLAGRVPSANGRSASSAQAMGHLAADCETTDPRPLLPHLSMGGVRMGRTSAPMLSSPLRASASYCTAATGSAAPAGGGGAAGPIGAAAATAAAAAATHSAAASGFAGSATGHHVFAGSEPSTGLPTRTILSPHDKLPVSDPAAAPGVPPSTQAQGTSRTSTSSSSMAAARAGYLYDSCGAGSYSTVAASHAPGDQRRSCSTHLGASSSLASLRHSSGFMQPACMYDSCDDRTSCGYGCSQHLMSCGDASVAALEMETAGEADLVAAFGPQVAVTVDTAAATAAREREVNYAAAYAARGRGAASSRPLRQDSGGIPPLPSPPYLLTIQNAAASGSNYHSHAQSVTSPSTPTVASGGGGGGSSSCGGMHALMSGSQQYMARAHEEVTILFADIASFTSMCGQVPPHVVMAFLNDLFTTFDQLVEKHAVYKVETIGDCYMVCGGLMEEDAEGFRSVTENVDPLHAHKVFAFAADMLGAARSLSMPGSGAPVQLRVGIHSGPVMSGIVGRKMPRFCLFGDTVNVASRMESTGVPGAVHVSAATRALLGSIADAFLPTGGMPVKGKGFMYTYLYDPTGCGARHLAASRSSGTVSRTTSDAQGQHQQHLSQSESDPSRSDPSRTHAGQYQRDTSQSSVSSASSQLGPIKDAPEEGRDAGRGEEQAKGSILIAE